MRYLKSNQPMLPSTTVNPAPELPMVPREFASPGLSLAQIISVVWAHRKQTLAIAAAITLVTAVVVKLTPKSFTATATLMVSPSISEQANDTPITVSYVSTQIDLMQSPEVLLPVVQRLKLTEDDKLAAGYNGDGSTLSAYVQQQLAKTLDIKQGDQANQLIYVAVTNNDPVKAAAITNSIGDVYIEKLRGWINDPANARAKQYSEQLAELQNKVKLAQDQVTAYRQKTGITDVTTQNDQEAVLLANLEVRLQDAQNARRASEAKTNTADLDTNALASDLVQDLKTQLATQQAELAQLKTTLGPQHPKVLALLSQLEATRRSLAAETQVYSKSQSADLNAARQLEQKLQAAVNEMRARVIGVSKLRDAGAKYQLELESAQSVYKRALDGYDQIMFASGRRDANVTFVSRAVPPVKAAKPNKIKLLILGIMAGGFFGLVGPFAYEMLLKRRVRCRDDFERDLGLPVLAEFNSVSELQVAS